MIANSAHVWKTFGFPAELASTRAQSEFVAPRDRRTTEVFDSIVREIFVPILKARRFTKRRNVWTRRLATIENSIDIQRGHATGDLLRFSVNWAVRIPGFHATLGQPDETVVGGRIGDFLDEGDDRWWSIQLGWLARDMPTVSDDAEACRREIRQGLSYVVAWLDEVDTIPALVRALDIGDRPLLRYDRDGLRETVERLRGLTGAR